MRMVVEFWQGPPCPLKRSAMAICKKDEIFSFWLKFNASKGSDCEFWADAKPQYDDETPIAQPVFM